MNNFQIVHCYCCHLQLLPNFTYWKTSLAVIKTNLCTEYRVRPTTKTMSLKFSLSNSSWKRWTTCFPSSTVSSEGSLEGTMSEEEQTLLASILWKGQDSFAILFLCQIILTSCLNSLQIDTLVNTCTCMCFQLLYPSLIRVSLILQFYLKKLFFLKLYKLIFM